MAGNKNIIGIIVEFIFLRIFDLIGLVFNIAACLTIVRLPCMIRQFKEMDNMNKWRGQGLVQLIIFICDIPCMAMFLCLLPFTLGIPLIKDIKRKNIKLDYTHKQPDGLYYGGPELRSLVLAHFFMLIFDLILFPFGVVVLFSWRCCKLIGIFKAEGWTYTGGDWRKKILNQFKELVMDLFCMILCLTLAILCPFQSWICLLEDDNHKRTRFLRYYKCWISDIAKKRNSVYQAMDEEFSASIIKGCFTKDVNKHLNIIMDRYLAKFAEIGKAISQPDVLPRLRHALSTVCWWESRRAHKMARLYMCERNFMVHPDINLHKRNITHHINEMIKFEANVSGAYRTLEEFIVPDAPLWKEKSGLSTRSRRETLKVPIDCLREAQFLVWIAICLNFTPLYRFPGLVVSLFRSWYNRRKIAFSCCIEYLKDLIALVQILLIIGLVFDAPWFFKDLMHVQSWRAMREMAGRHSVLMLKKLFFLILTPFILCEFYFQIMIYSPYNFLNLFCQCSTPNISNQKMKLFMYLFVIVLFLVLPMLFVGDILFPLEGHTKDKRLIIVGGFLVFHLVYQFIMLCVKIKQMEENNLLMIKPTPYEFLRFNYENFYYAIFGLLVEFFLVASLIFSVAELPALSGNILHHASQILLLNVVPARFKYLAIAGIFVIWFLLISAPTVLEDITKRFSVGTCAKQPGWHFLVSLLLNPLFLFIFTNMCSLLVIDWYDPSCPELRNITGISNMTSPYCNQSETNRTACLTTHIECKNDFDQNVIAVFVVLYIMWYSSTALQFGLKYGDSGYTQLDLQFSSLYNILINILKAIMAVIITFSLFDVTITLSVLIALNSSAVFLTLFFKRCSKTFTCNSRVLYTWRLASFLGTTVITISAYVAVDNPESYIPLWVLSGGLGFILFVAIISSMALRKLSESEKARKQFKREILALEKKFYKDKIMIDSWKKKRKSWRILVKNAEKANENQHEIMNEHLNAVGPVIENPTVNSPADPPPPDYPSLPPPSYLSAVQNPPPSYLEIYPSGRSEPHVGTPDQPEGQTNSETSEFFLHVDDNVLNSNQLRTFSQVFTGIQESADNAENHPNSTFSTHGNNLLLDLLDNIHYTSFSYSFLSQIALWKQSVNNSKWQGLFHSLAVLESVLTKSFNTPRGVDVALSGGRYSGFVLPPDTQIGEPEPCPDS